MGQDQIEIKITLRRYETKPSIDMYAKRSHKFGVNMFEEMAVCDQRSFRRRFINVVCAYLLGVKTPMILIEDKRLRKFYSYVQQCMDIGHGSKLSWHRPAQAQRDSQRREGRIPESYAFLMWIGHWAAVIGHDQQAGKGSILASFFGHEMDQRWTNNMELWEQLQGNDFPKQLFAELLDIIQRQKANAVKWKIATAQERPRTSSRRSEKEAVEEWLDKSQNQTPPVTSSAWSRSTTGPYYGRRTRPAFCDPPSTISSETVLNSMREGRLP